MKAAVALSFGEDNPSIELRHEWPRPQRQQGKSLLLLRNLACSTAFGDVHMLSGRLSLVFKPPSFPYIPGKDVCGIVEEADPTSKFKQGDVVVAAKGFEACGGMAEYVVVPESEACLKPASVDALVAACCPDSPVTALLATKAAKLRGGERVLVLGGSGGVGSALVQLVKLTGPSFLASTSTQGDMLKHLGVDVVVDYRTQNWWESEEFSKQPFDVVIDCVGGGNHFVKSQKVLRNKWHAGRFVAVVGDDPLPVARTVYQFVSFVMGMLYKPLWTPFIPWVPWYKMVVPGSGSANLEKILSLVDEGKLNIPLDPASPLPFTAEGVKTALTTQASGHAHGKVVVELMKDKSQ